MNTVCPICGEMSLVAKHGEYRHEPPANIPGGTMVVPAADWEECTACKERILSLALEAELDAQRYRRLGLLTPAEIKAIRVRAGLSQVAMAQEIGVGDKTYARWESGTMMHNRGNDNLIRLVAFNPGQFALVEAQRQPDRQQVIAAYVASLETLKGQHPVAMAAHDGALDATRAGKVRARLLELRDAKRGR